MRLMRTDPPNPSRFMVRTLIKSRFLPKGAYCKYRQSGSPPGPAPTDGQARDTLARV